MKYLIIIALIVVIGGGFLFFQLNSSKNNQEVVAACTGDEDPDVTVEITDEGFSPEEVSIERCQTVEWLNNTDEEHWPASDLHPTHEIYSEFDQKEPIEPGESWTFTFNRVGEWRYHDHLFSINRGKVVVE